MYLTVRDKKYLCIDEFNQLFAEAEHVFIESVCVKWKRPNGDWDFKFKGGQFTNEYKQFKTVKRDLQPSKKNQRIYTGSQLADAISNPNVKL